MPAKDRIGQRGEWITQLKLTESDDNEYLFQPQFLGDKYPAIDLIVELLGADDGIRPFFFAHVRATTLGYDGRGHLRVAVNEAEMRALVAYQVPTYVIGVDTTQPYRAFLMAALATAPVRFASLPSRHELEAGVLRQLYQEVLGFWRAHPAPFRSSRFV